MNCQVLNVIGVDGTNSIEIIDEEFGKREDGIGYQVFPDTKTTLDKIKRMGLKIGLVSNCPMRMAIKRRPMLKQTGILHYFDAIILSGEVGYQKPQPTIFEMALKKLEINDPSTVLHVGDCLFDDVYGAKNVGIVPILFDPLDVNYVENIIKLEKLSDILQYLE